MTRTQVKEPNQKVHRKTKSECSTTSRKPGLGVIKERAEENEERLALLTDKKLKIYDSHAVDYSTYNDSSKDEEILDALLPMHLRKNKPKKAKSKAKEKKKVQNKIDKEVSKETKKDLEQKFTACAVICEEDDDGTSVSSEMVSSRRLSVVTELLIQTSLQRKPSQESSKLNEFLIRENTKANATETPTIQSESHEDCRSETNAAVQPHATLRSFLKHYREQRSKDQRLKRVQSQAKIKTPKTDQKQQLDPKSIKHESFLPLLVDKPSLNQTNTRSPDRIDFGTKKMPKIYKKRRRKAFNVNKDPRFQKLVSSLTPSYDGEETSIFPFIVSK